MPWKNKERKKAQIKIWKEKNRANIARIEADRRVRVRKEALNLLGGKCAWCGESDSIVLDFDHLEDDGNKEKSSVLAGRVKKNPNRFQVLCKNCNWRKEHWRRRNAFEEKWSRPTKGDGCFGQKTAYTLEPGKRPKK
jgi:hypothetical protein